MSAFKSNMEKVKLWFRKQWGWVVTFAAFVAFFALFGMLYSYGILFVALKEDLGSGASPTSWVGSIAIGFHTLGSFISNPLIARFGSRLIASIGLVMCVGSLVITSFMPSIMPMFFTFSVLFGIGINMVLIASISLILKYFPKKNCSRATSMALIGTTSGMLAMNLFIFYLVTNLGWRNMLRVMAGIILALGIPSISTYSQPPTPPTEVADEAEKKKPLAASEPAPSKAAIAKAAEAEGLLPPSSSSQESETKQTTEVRMNEKEVKVQIPGKKPTRMETVKRCLVILTYPEIYFLALGLMGCAMTMSFYYVSMVNFMTTAGIQESMCAIIMTVIAVAEVFGKICLSAFGDHLPFPKIYLFVIASLLGIGVMFGLMAAKSIAAMMCIAVVTGFFIMTVFDALPYSICNQVFGAARSVESCTVILIANGLGLILGSLFGESVDRTGSYDDAIYASVGIYCVATLLYLLVPLYQRCFASDRYIMARTKPKSEDESDSMGPFESWIFNPPPIETTELYFDIESSV
ncbi:monocarboxylate transporter 7-like [Diadema antillarum]|uniref:monocarboxylate transporter 7-like n=1 Tax=Diadema antillarum TaxID=105358 RepID=UPI003A84DCDA